jgi:hypothetical protein
LARLALTLRVWMEALGGDAARAFDLPP